MSALFIFGFRFIMSLSIFRTFEKSKNKDFRSVIVKKSVCFVRVTEKLCCDELGHRNAT